MVERSCLPGPVGLCRRQLRLQRHIDPLEVRPAAWIDLVELANAWQHYEAWGRAPRTGGPEVRTKEKIRQAIAVATQTGMGRNAVAHAIGVHATLISHWPKRVEATLGKQLAATLKPSEDG
jgi:hypothetical protein